IPPGVSEVTFDVQGAESGDCVNTISPSLGKGARAQGVLDVSGYSTLYLYVGAPGADRVGGSQFGGGADGGDGGNHNPNFGGGGGAASEIRADSTIQAARVVVAGGGGGPGASLDSSSDGGDAGHPTGEPATRGGGTSG